MSYQFLTTRQEGAVEYLTLNRPEVRNALNDVMIAELTGWAASVREAAARGSVRAVVLAGAGKSFCAGADIAWMAKTVAYTTEENLQDAVATARMFGAIDTLPVPVIGRIHAGAIGGGAGLAAVCDIAVADEQAVFGFPEVRLGIIPAVISPFVLAKIGRSAARELFLTGRRFPATRAQEIGLVHVVVPADELDRTVARYVEDVLASAPQAVAEAKALIAEIWGRPAADADPITASAIAHRRVSVEGQEGLRAFLGKHTPSWAEDALPTDRPTNRPSSGPRG
jgi:methylglutaconyl-CoA hydratase